MTKNLGLSIQVDYLGCNSKIIDDLDLCLAILLDAAYIANLTVLGQQYHKFQPQGVSINLLLAESSLGLHTWPELGTACIDCFTCGDQAKPLAIIDPIFRAFRAKEYTITSQTRGIK